MLMIEKAKKLYLDCDNCNPNESTLMGFQVPWFKEKDVYQIMFVGMTINKLATKELNDSEWIEKENIFPTNSKEDRKIRDKAIYKLLKKGIFEEKEIDNKKFYRLTDKIDGLFDCENYRTREMA